MQLALGPVVSIWEGNDVLRLLSALLITLLLPLGASALIIDTFDDPATVTANSGTPADNDATASGSFLGTNRQLDAVWTSGANDVDGEIDSGGSSLLNISLGADTLGSVSVLWQNIANADLTGGGTLNAIGLEIVFDDLPADITITVTDGNSNSGSSTTTAPGGIFLPTTQALLFSSFSGSVDFSDVVEIELVVLPLFPAADLQIDFIETIDVPTPEPSAAALLLGGVIGVLALRRRR